MLRTLEPLHRMLDDVRQSSLFHDQTANISRDPKLSGKSPSSRALVAILQKPAIGATTLNDQGKSVTLTRHGIFTMAFSSASLDSCRSFRTWNSPMSRPNSRPYTTSNWQSLVLTAVASRLSALCHLSLLRPSSSPNSDRENLHLGAVTVSATPTFSRAMKISVKTSVSCSSLAWSTHYFPTIQSV